MNARKHRQLYQAKGTDRLEPKGKQPVWVLDSGLPRVKALPVYRADPNHPVKVAEHGNVASLPGFRDRAHLPQGGCRGSNIGKTEEAKASLNPLDKPTSVWSFLARKLAEPSKDRESK
jgi:hypothetical protein